MGLGMCTGLMILTPAADMDPMACTMGFKVWVSGRISGSSIPNLPGTYYIGP